MKLLGKGSARDIYLKDNNNAYLEFTDRISVFDYGALDDQIPGKGKFSARVAEKLFYVLEGSGLKSAFIARHENGIELEAAGGGKFNFENAKLNFIPLEVIFRLGVPPGSSLLKRNLKLKAFDRFEKPLIEFSTKLETRDRIIDEKEAAQLAGSIELIPAMREAVEKVAITLKSFFDKIGLVLWDGKVELGFNPEDQSVYLLDPITQDELRVTLPGLDALPMSKELLRQWLGSSHWGFEQAKAKKQFGESWKEHVTKAPRLGLWRQEKLAHLYEAFSYSVDAENGRALMDWVRGVSDRAPKVFILGEGGRETAQRWRLEKEKVCIVDSPDQADAVWVSKDGDLAAGKTEEYLKEGHWVFGPSKEASKIEWSKSFGSEIASLAGIPRAESTNDLTKARAFPTPPVVKFDGLAGGKGVVLANDWSEFEEAVNEWSPKGELLFEERLDGPELSLFYYVNCGAQGTTVQFLSSAQDFKRRYAGDEGLNTGGMGAYVPSPLVEKKDLEYFQKWAQATANVLYEKGLSYNGILYIGALKDKQKGWCLLEYNARFGDPETQAIVTTLDSQSYFRRFLQLDVNTEFKNRSHEDVASVCLALVSPEYPKKSAPLELEEWNPKKLGVNLFMSGSKSGRIAYLVGNGGTGDIARERVFEALLECPWKDRLEWRADIVK